MTAIFFIISNNNPIYSLLALISCFINFSFLLFFLHLDFFALVYIIVYVGAICVLFLFVILLLNLRSYMIKEKFNLFTLSFFLISLIFFFFISLLGEMNPTFSYLFSTDFFLNMKEGIPHISLIGLLYFSSKWDLLLVSLLLLLLVVVSTIFISIPITFVYKKTLFQKILRKVEENKGFLKISKIPLLPTPPTWVIVIWACGVIWMMSFYVFWILKMITTWICEKGDYVRILRLYRNEYTLFHLYFKVRHQIIFPFKEMYFLVKPNRERMKYLILFPMAFDEDVTERVAELDAYCDHLLEIILADPKLSKLVYDLTVRDYDDENKDK